jgi:hypothetical protein
MGKGRIVLSLLLVVVGAGLLAYGLFRNSVTVYSRPAAPPAVATLDGEPAPVSVPAVAQPAATSEPAVTQEVARGGVTRDASGQIKKTYEEGKQAPRACPT